MVFIFLDHYPGEKAESHRGGLTDNVSNAEKEDERQLT